MRNEYPRMDKKRENYQMLNGKWDFAFDVENVGLRERWYNSFPEQGLEIQVPFAYQSELSGVENKIDCDVIWYRKKVLVKSGFIKLNFGAIDFESDIYVNKLHVMNHKGGETPIEIDYYNEKDQELEIIVRAFDPLSEEQIPRGKQSWEGKSRGIWYTPTSGIWQPVWIDYVSEHQIEKIQTNSKLIEGIQEFRIIVTPNSVGKKIKLTFTDSNMNLCIVKDITNVENYFAIEMYNNKIFRTPFHGGGIESICWSPEHPRLFNYTVEIIDGEDSLDLIQSYFGFREIITQNGMTYLNNNPYYFKLVLDQGYWKSGLLTAPSDEDYIKDISAAKDLGFNGCRKHQKVEDPRFLYWADKLGFLVWGEVSSAPVFSSKAVRHTQENWFEIIERDFNHPSIVAWVPLNESWGVPFINNSKKQQAHSMSLYYQLKSLDDTRIVVNNDGWEMTKTDICAIHNYNHGAIDEGQKQQYFEEIMQSKEKILNSRPAGKPLYASGYDYEIGTPILITEFGGISFDTNDEKSWGYTAVNSPEILISEYKRIIDAFSKSDAIFGYVYTQLYDVEQEVNGFLTYDREPKCDIEKIKEINNSIFYRY